MYLDHGMDISDAIKVVIRKDDFIESKPWHADVHFDDGHVWKGWQQFFRTRNELVRTIQADYPAVTIEV